MPLSGWVNVQAWFSCPGSSHSDVTEPTADASRLVYLMCIRSFLCLSTLVASLPLVAALPIDNRQAQPDEWGYRPTDGGTVALNPPSFTWIAQKNAASYSVQWSRSSDFKEAVTVEKVAWPTYTHYEAVNPGRYFWRFRYTDGKGALSDWSQVRSVEVPASATVLPMPTVVQQMERIPRQHPRLFMRPEDLPRLRELAKTRESAAMASLRKAADSYIKAGPTPEPVHKGSARFKDQPELIKYWWPNREQAEKACAEAETLAFVYLITGEPRYGEAARRWMLHLASWDPAGTTNFGLNCEAGKPLLYRPARAYDWAWDVFSREERVKIQAWTRARILDAWNSGEVQKGVGHLQKPYNSHGNRVWHKIAEAGIAYIDEIPEAPQWVDYAVNKFFACYPVWSDDDGGWHEGVSYWSGYQSKAVWWLQVARSALGIDGLKKPFFAQVGDYPLYIAPPHSPNAGFGDLSFRPLSAPNFLEYHLRVRGADGNGGHAGYWAWWAREKDMKPNGGVLGFLYRANLPPMPEPRSPEALPQSKVFHGIGVASLHRTLVDSRNDVHLLFKSSPFGSQSHGHNPQNSFQLNAYGDALIPACTYRDLHGSKFHYQWVHSTAAQNAVLVNGVGQVPHSVKSTGKIVRERLTPEYDYVAGDATQAYAGKLTKAWRHVVLIKGEHTFAVLFDELIAPQPSRFQFMLHAYSPFTIDQQAKRLELRRKVADLDVAYFSTLPMAFKQTDGFVPAPSKPFPNMWHVEAGTTDNQSACGMITLLIPKRAGEALVWNAQRNDTAEGSTFDVTVGGSSYRLQFPRVGSEAVLTVTKR